MTLADGRRLRLDQVATISDTVAEPRSAALLNGQPVVGFEVSRSRGASEIEVGAAVQKALTELRAAHPDIELTESELEAMDDIRVQDELTATVAELPAPTEEMVARYNEKMEFLASIRAEIPALNVVEETTEESYAVPSGRYDYVYSMGTI